MYFDIPRTNKVLKPVHEYPGELFADFFLLPSGYYLNRDFEYARKGDKIEFYSGETAYVEMVCKLDMNTEAADALCQMRYGIGIKAILKKWQHNAVLLGDGKNSVSPDECLIVFYVNKSEVCSEGTGTEGGD